MVPHDSKKGILYFSFSFSLSLPLSPLYVAHIFQYRLLSPGGCFFPLLHQKLILDRDSVLVFLRAIKISQGLSKISRQGRTCSETELIVSFGISPAFFEAQCFTYFLRHMGNWLFWGPRKIVYFFSFPSPDTFWSFLVLIPCSILLLMMI